MKDSETAVSSAKSPGTVAASTTTNKWRLFGKSRPGIFQCHTFLWLLFIWAPAAIAGIYTKSAILRWDGYLKTALSLSRPVPSDDFDAARLFSWGERISFFRADLLLSVAIIPLILLWLSRWRRHRVSVWIAAATSIFWIAILTIQLEAFRLIGNFQSLDLLEDSVQWGLENSGQAKAYIGGMALLRLLFLVSISLAAAWAASSRRLLSRGWPPQWQKAASLAGTLSLGILALAWLPWMPRTAMHDSVHLATLAALPDRTVSLNFKLPARAELERRYHALAHVPPRVTPPDHWAAARNFDVLFFVLETTPQRCVAFDGRIDDLPNLRKLREHAWIGARHYTTFPTTSRALFSLLTSMYPADNSADPVRFRDKVDSGLIRNLDAAGYQTAVYGSTASIAPGARDVFENLGFRQIRAISGGSSASAGDPQSSEPYVVHQQVLDLLALDRLKADVRHWNKANQRFAAVYLPQISHGPWGDIRSSNGQQTNLINRCRALVQVQDGWLGDLLRLLDEDGALSRTLIVVVGDHGVRTQVEDPALPTGVTDNYTYQVPFLLYSPQVLDTAVTLPWITSHIDVAPSILDLLGISRNAGDEQGMDLWDPRTAARTTFFLGNLYLGVDGYHSAGKFYSWNRVLDVTYGNNDLHFRRENVIPARSTSHDEITKNILELDELRTAFFRTSEK